MKNTVAQIGTFFTKYNSQHFARKGDYFGIPLNQDVGNRKTHISKNHILVALKPNQLK